MPKILKSDKGLFFRLDAHYRLLIALVVSAIIFFCLRSQLATAALILVTWIGGAISIILLNWIIILQSHPREVRKIAGLQDSSQTFLFLFITTASVMSLGAIVYLLKSTRGLPELAKNEHILLAIAAVIISWWQLHTIFTLRYAHLFYTTETDAHDDVKPMGGLQFPGRENPDYLDFVYFSFIVGMTFQVSDINITSRRIRRVCIVHALLSFAFNTAILALSINIISGMVA